MSVLPRILHGLVPVGRAENNQSEGKLSIDRRSFDSYRSLSLQVTTVDMQKPPPDFRTNFEATHPPILIDGGLAILENDKIERHIMKSVPGGHNLFVQDKEVATLIENLYSKLKLVLVKKDEQKNNSLLAHLKKINDHLQHRNSRFLTGDTMCCFDCELM